MSSSEDIQAKIVTLMARANIPGRLQSMSLCDTGGNNCTYRVVTTHSVFAAKHYFRHEGDSRDRLGTEFSFSRYAAKTAAGMSPAPLAIDQSAGLGLYEFIDGEPFTVNSVRWNHVQNAINFFLSLNSSASRAEARLIPYASEACFSISEHLHRVSNRLDILAAEVPVIAENADANELIRSISNYWIKLVAHVLVSAQSANMDINESLPVGERCISPSDFGFHNALSMPDQSTRFIDFEYAGWDDPAKMTGDFFSQLAVPVPSQYFERFVNDISVVFQHPEKLIKRAAVLRPVYQVKWCCIALNCFLPVHLARRKFANPQLNELEYKRAQLLKAQAIFQFLPLL